MIQIVCHRGANEFAPENTYASTQICLDWGMDIVEIDVNSSRDGVLYLFHGPQLERASTGRGLIMEHDAAEIDLLDAGSWFAPEFAGERIPRLAEFLPWVKGRAGLFLDVKFGDLDEVVRLIRATDLADETFFWFQHNWMARCFRRIAPDLRLKINAATLGQIEAAQQEFDAQIIEIDLANVTEEMMNACRNREMQVMINYGGDDPARLQTMLAWRPDFVNVNYGDRVARLAREMGLR